MFFFQHRCCFFTWCAFTYRGTHLYYCSRLRKLRQQRSSVSFGRLHKEAGAAEALKTEWDRCLHFHSSSIFHEDSSFKHQVKLGVQSKGLNLCSASDVWPEGAPVPLRKIIVEHAHGLKHSRTDAHISCEAPMKVPPSCCISGGRWRGETLNKWGDGGTCSGKHVVRASVQSDFLNLRVAMAVSRQEHYQLLQQQEKQERKTSMERKLNKGDGSLGASAGMTACICSKSLSAVWVETVNEVVKLKEVWNITSGHLHCTFSVSKTSSVELFLALTVTLSSPERLK